MIRRRVVVRGTVQGVFYRNSCQREARRRDVTGWVANRADGTVEAVFEGAADDVESLLAWAARGPVRARVTAVEVSEEEPQGEQTFAVLNGSG